MGSNNDNSLWAVLYFLNGPSIATSLANSAHIYYSTNKATSWTKTASFPIPSEKLWQASIAIINKVMIVYCNAKHFSTYSGFYRSTDYGATWSKIVTGNVPGLAYGALNTSGSPFAVNYQHLQYSIIYQTYTISITSDDGATYTDFFHLNQTAYTAPRFFVFSQNKKYGIATSRLANSGTGTAAVYLISNYGKTHTLVGSVTTNGATTQTAPSPYSSFILTDNRSSYPFAKAGGTAANYSYMAGALSHDGKVQAINLYNTGDTSVTGIWISTNYGSSFSSIPNSRISGATAGDWGYIVNYIDENYFIYAYKNADNTKKFISTDYGATFTTSTLTILQHYAIIDYDKSNQQSYSIAVSNTSSLTFTQETYS
jgi:hypothetical protein